MSTIEPDDVVVAAEDQLSTTVDDEVVVLNHATGTYHGLRGIGPRIWELIQEPTPVREITRTVRAEYEVGADRCAREVSEFIDEMAEASLVDVDDGAATGVEVHDGASG